MNALSLPFVQIGILTGLLAGVALAYCGVFVVARRTSFSGLAASQLAGFGTVAAAILASHGSFLWAWVFVLAGLVLLERIDGNQRAPKDGLVAALYVAAAGLAVLFLSKAPLGENHAMTILFGNILGLTKADALESAAALALVLGFLFPFYYRYIWLSFSPESAAVSGLRGGLWRFLFQALLSLVVTFGIHLFGVLMAFSLLVFPALIAFMTARRAGGLLALVPCVVVAAVIGGFLISFHVDLPTGPFISTVLALTALAGALFRRGRTA